VKNILTKLEDLFKREKTHEEEQQRLFDYHLQREEIIEEMAHYFPETTTMTRYNKAKMLYKVIEPMFENMYGIYKYENQE
jgi:hypothetical protein